MASDLIDRKEFIKRFCGEQCGCKREECGYEYVEDGHDACFIVEEIEKAPAVDAVEVVRCKDCVHAGAFPNAYSARRFEGGMNCYLCRGDDGYGIANVSVVYPDDYCSDGVKKDGGKQDA